MILTTIDSVPGRTIESTIGLVLACIPYAGSKYEEGLKDLRGNTTPDLPAVLERRRAEVLNRLIKRGLVINADAIVGVRLDTREITPAWKELLAYGTAVTLT